MGLVIRLKRGESLRVGEVIVTPTKTRRGDVTLLIDAPTYLKIRHERRAVEVVDTSIDSGGK